MARRMPTSPSSGNPTSCDLNPPYANSGEFFHRLAGLPYNCPSEETILAIASLHKAPANSDAGAAGELVNMRAALHYLDGEGRRLASRVQRGQVTARSRGSLGPGLKVTEDSPARLVVSRRWQPLSALAAVPAPTSWQCATRHGPDGCGAPFSPSGVFPRSWPQFNGWRSCSTVRRTVSIHRSPSSTGSPGSEHRSGCPSPRRGSRTAVGDRHHDGPRT
jgi:hypothetical protein